MLHYAGITRQGLIRYGQSSGKILSVYSRLLLKKAEVIRKQALAGIRAATPIVRDRLYQYALLIRLNKPTGIYLLLWPTLWALWIAAAGIPDMHILVVFVLGVFLMRSGGCILNDLADMRFDGEVERTRTRRIVAGFVTPREALFVAATLILTAFLLVLTLNRLTLQLSVVGIVLATIYPYMKRYTYLPQLFLGLAFGWGIPMAFAAQTGTVPKLAWLILVGNVLWSLVYDTIYAMVDRDDDLRIGVKSTAILFDDADRVIIGITQVLLLIVLILTGRQAELGGFYFTAVTGAFLLSIYQQYLIRERDREGCMRAFQNNNWFGAVIFLGILVDYQF